MRKVFLILLVAWTGISFAAFNTDRGQMTMANSFPQVIASDQSPIPVTQSGSWTNACTQSGTWTVQQGTPPWSVSQSGTWSTGRTWTLSSGTDSVSAAQSGTWTVQQGSAPWSFNQTQVNGVAVSVGNGVAGTGVQRVAIASDNTPFTVNAAQSGTWNINNISGTISLPTGASTSALQTTGNTSLASIDSKLTAPLSVNQTQVNGVTVSTGNGVAGTGTQRVTIASDNTPFTVSATQGTSPWVTTSSAAAITTASNSIVSVSNSVSTAVLASNSNRKMAYIMNNSNKSLWIKLGATAVVGQGIEVGAGGSFGIDATTLWTGAVNGIVSGGSAQNIDVFEGTP